MCINFMPLGCYHIHPLGTLIALSRSRAGGSICISSDVIAPHLASSGVDVGVAAGKGKDSNAKEGATADGSGNAASTPTDTGEAASEAADSNVEDGSVTGVPDAVDLTSISVKACIEGGFVKAGDAEN